MSNIKMWPDCSMRTGWGNCDPAGGFCTAVSKEICEALHNAYFRGYYDGVGDGWKKALDKEEKKPWATGKR